MRCVVQRVSASSVSVANQIVGRIEKGLMVLVGFTEGDTIEIIDKMIQKLLYLRIFDDENGVMNKSVLDIHGKILLVSQFTLYGDAKKGNRPSYIKALPSSMAKPLYDEMVKKMKAYIPVEVGVFGAYMQVEIHNDGPTTILLEM